MYLVSVGKGDLWGQILKPIGHIQLVFVSLINNNNRVIALFTTTSNGWPMMRESCLHEVVTDQWEFDVVFCQVDTYILFPVADSNADCIP